MIGAFWYKDIVTLRYRKRSFLMNIVTIAIFLILMKYVRYTTGAMWFGADFIRITLLSLIGIFACMEHYASSLAQDKRNGVLAYVMLNGGSRAAYCFIKAVVPVMVATLSMVLSVGAYLLFVSNKGLGWRSFGFFGGVVLSEVFLALAVGLVLNLLSNVDIKENPGVALWLILINLPMLYFVSPFRHFGLFCLLTLGAGVLGYVVVAVLLRRQFKNNLASIAG
jgi:hypothetical protein